MAKKKKKTKIFRLNGTYENSAQLDVCEGLSMSVESSFFFIWLTMVSS